jgi:hypothetical protein
VYGPDGTPLLSWRVLLLPYLEQEDLYKQFKLDEPWDSEHNIRLLERMPATYAAPGHKKSLYPAHHTVCHVFVGPGTAFEGPRGLAFKDFPDGQSDTLLIVEAGDPVPWTKPANISFDPNRVVVPRGPFRDGFRASMGDGSVRFIRYDVSESRLRSAIMRNDGGWERLD